MSRISKQTEVLGGVYRSMIDTTQNDVHTFKEWCDDTASRTCLTTNLILSILKWR